MKEETKIAKPKLRAPTRKIHIDIVSNKGGVGKTALANAIISSLRNPDCQERLGFSSYKVAAYNADPENTEGMKALGGASSNPMKTVTQIDTNSRDGTGDLVNMLDSLSAEADMIVVDHAANNIKVIDKIVNDAEAYFKEFEDAGFTNYVILPVDNTADSVLSIRAAVANFGDLPTYITVINENTIDIKDSQGLYNTMYAETKSEIFQGQKHIEWIFPKLSSVEKLTKKMYRGYFEEGTDLPIPGTSNWILERHKRIAWRLEFQTMESLLRTIVS